MFVVLVKLPTVVSIIANPVSRTRGFVVGSRKRRIALVCLLVFDLLWELAFPLFMLTV